MLNSFTQYRSYRALTLGQQAIFFFSGGAEEGAQCMGHGIKKFLVYYGCRIVAIYSIDQIYRLGKAKDIFNIYTAYINTPYI